ncbi:hypothetical protein DV737_g4314, partial [Chaetothyriales sp. CBS 132003]
MHLPQHLRLLLLLLACLATSVSAWGSLGHRTVAYLATLYSSSSNTTHMVNSLLLGQDISEAALFADKVAHMPSFAYSRPWHYIDAADDPPRSCGINITRDCPSASASLPLSSSSTGCIVSALSNQTRRVQDTSLPRWARGQSLRFVLHFVGDVHQPLHTEGLERGGNDIGVRFDGRAANLHAVWDTLVVHKWRRREEWFDRDRAVESEEEAAFAWALDLFKSDAEGADLSGECVFGDDGNGDGDVVDCVMQWAQQANRWVCDYVLRDGVDAVQAVDLGQEYYEGAKEIVDVQIRRAGRRLAKWLDSSS